MTNLLKIFNMSQGYIIYTRAQTFCGGGVRVRCSPNLHCLFTICSLSVLLQIFPTELAKLMKISQDFTEGVSYLHHLQTHQLAHACDKTTHTGLLCVWYACGNTTPVWRPPSPYHECYRVLITPLLVKGYIKHITHMMRGIMMLGFGLMNLFLGISLLVLCTVGIVSAGISALPLAVWVMLLAVGSIAALAGLFMATID